MTDNKQEIANNEPSKDDDDNKDTTTNPKKRTYIDMQSESSTTDNDHNNNANHNEPDAKRQKLEKSDSSISTEITREDMEFLFKLKQNQNKRNNNNHYNLSLHSSLIHRGPQHFNMTTDINHLSHFKPPSIASTNNSTTLDALSVTAAIHTNPNPSTLTISDLYNHENEPQEKDKEKYYTKIVNRSSRVGDTYQASILPDFVGDFNEFNKYNDKYGGSKVDVEEPAITGNNLRNERDQKRTLLSKKYDNDNDHDEIEPTEENNKLFLKMLNANYDDEDEDDEDDEDFNLNEDCYNDNNDDGITEQTQNKRIMEGIITRRSDWLPGDDGTPNDNQTRLQYLVKWKDSVEPRWEFADELEMYQEEIDKFEDDEMEDMVDDEHEQFENLNIDDVESNINDYVTMNNVNNNNINKNCEIIENEQNNNDIVNNDKEQ